jgi:hypothetical protein
MGEVIGRKDKWETVNRNKWLFTFMASRRIQTTQLNARNELLQALSPGSFWTKLLI